MTRREIREQVFILLFQRESFDEQKETYMETKEWTEKDQAYIEEHMAKIMDKLPEIDELISEHSNGWKLDRIGKEELAILRLAIYEAKFDEEIPVGVAVNEAVELAKTYGEDGGAAFVNGISYSNHGVFTCLSTSFSMCPEAPSTIYPTQSISRTFNSIPSSVFIDTASFGTNFGSVVMIVVPDADCGSSSFVRSFLCTSVRFGRIRRSANLLINVDLPVRTGPTTPR